MAGVSVRVSFSRSSFVFVRHSLLRLRTSHEKKSLSTRSVCTLLKQTRHEFLVRSFGLPLLFFIKARAIVILREDVL